MRVTVLIWTDVQGAVETEVIVVPGIVTVRPGAVTVGPGMVTGDPWTVTVSAEPRIVVVET